MIGDEMISVTMRMMRRNVCETEISMKTTSGADVAMTSLGVLFYSMLGFDAIVDFVTWISFSIAIEILFAFVQNGLLRDVVMSIVTLKRKNNKF